MGEKHATVSRHAENHVGLHVQQAGNATGVGKPGPIDLSSQGDE